MILCDLIVIHYVTHCYPVGSSVPVCNPMPSHVTPCDPVIPCCEPMRLSATLCGRDPACPCTTMTLCVTPYASHMSVLCPHWRPCVPLTLCDAMRLYCDSMVTFFDHMQPCCSHMRRCGESLRFSVTLWGPYVTQCNSVSHYATHTLMTPV